jgi:hypothetical protein
VESAQLVEGRYYALRENPRQVGTPLLKVKLVVKVGRRGHVKVRYEEAPHRGLEEYVATRQLIVPWSERRSFARDEERMLRLKEFAGERRDTAREEAVSAVLAASGEPSAGAWGGICSMPEDEIQRIADRAGLNEAPVKLHHLGFVDRFGEVNLPLEGAEALARAFAAAEPENVLMYLDDQEEELRLSGNEPGYRYRHNLLRQYQPGFALARQWAGFDREVEELQKEIARLRSLISRASSELKAAGADGKARWLIRALEGR